MIKSFFEQILSPWVSKCFNFTKRWCFEQDTVQKVCKKITRTTPNNPKEPQKISNVGFGVFSPVYRRPALSAICREALSNRIQTRFCQIDSLSEKILFQNQDRVLLRWHLSAHEPYPSLHSGSTKRCKLYPILVQSCMCTGRVFCIWLLYFATHSTFSWKYQVLCRFWPNISWPIFTKFIFPNSKALTSYKHSDTL